MTRCLLMLALVACAAAADQDDDLDRLPVYAPTAMAPAALRYAGSSTLANLVNRAAGALRAVQSGITVAVEAGGSGAAPAALAGGADLVGMTRAMSEDEQALVARARGAKPFEVVVGYDALAVFVQRGNPLPAITLVQLDGLLSAARKRGSPPLVQWRDLGVTDGAWADRRITVFGNHPQSGGSALLREVVTQGMAFAAHVSQEPVASSIVQGVAADDGGIGCASVLLLTAATRVLPVAGADGRAVLPTRDTCIDGSYPLARALRLYVVPHAGRLDQPLAALLRFLCSAEAQRLVAADGNYALTPDLAGKQVMAIDLNAWTSGAR